MRAALVSALSALALTPALASGHSDDMTSEELLETIAQAGGASQADLENIVLSEVGAAEGEEPGAAVQTGPGRWYSRAPIAARIGSSAEDPYTLAGGCFSMRPAEGGAPVVREGSRYLAGGPATDAEVFRFQATELGSYLLLGSDGRFPALQDGNLTSLDAPASSAIWTVEGDAETGYVLIAQNGAGLEAGPSGRLAAGDGGERFRLEPQAQCAGFPEIEVNTTGRPYRAKPNFGAASGTIDLHSHMMAFEGFGRGLHCGRPWHPLGVASALVDCPDHAPNGLGGLAANLLVFQDPARTHDPEGWPSFTGWPTYEWVFTHEQTYYRWIERAWRGGLRLVTLLAVDNSAACLVNVQRTEDCNEMDAVRRQIQAAKDLQEYIDAQAGGPGKGFFRIVRNPFKARRVINKGKLAVVLGIEVSEPFDCGLRNGVPQCDEDDVDEELDAVWDAGVRQMEIVNKFDNAFGGVAMDGGFSGPVINSANKIVTGEYWDVETCQGTGDDQDREQVTAVPPEAAALIALLPGGPAQLPAYPPAPHCNVRGLSGLGKHLIRRFEQRGMIFDPDHLSVYARDEALALVERLRYSGVVSSHSWGDDTSYRRIMELGGVVTPMADHADVLDEQWKAQRALYKAGKGSRRYGFGFGFGDDMNGFGGPRRPTAGSSAEVTYPFKSPIDPGVTVDKQQSGTKTFDINTDGVAHFGQWPDWTEGVQNDAGNRVIRDLRGGAESYLRMWERAWGTKGPRKLRARRSFDSKGLGKLRLELGPKQVLRRVAQPVSRSRGWSFKVRRSRGKRAGAYFKGTKVALVASAARGHSADGVRPGDAASAIPGSAEELGAGLFTAETSRQSRYVYRVKGDKVAWVGVAKKGLAGNAKALARGARLALRR
jgi:microsomal dipeptidase-like Zn-dependent dipeptidase